MYLSSVGLSFLCLITTTIQSRDQILRRERGQGNIYFPCSADHDQDWQPYPVDPYTCYMCDHTYVCMCNHTAYRIGYSIAINQEYHSAGLIGTSTVYMYHASPVTNECDMGALNNASGSSALCVWMMSTPGRPIDSFRRPDNDAPGIRQWC